MCRACWVQNPEAPPVTAPQNGKERGLWFALYLIGCIRACTDAETPEASVMAGLRYLPASGRHLPSLVTRLLPGPGSMRSSTQ